MVGSILDLEISRPNQIALLLNMSGEDQCISNWVYHVLEKQRCHFVDYIGTTSGSAPEEETGNDECILNALDPCLDDYSPMNSEEYAAALKRTMMSLQKSINNPSPNKSLRP
jgi:hypothetical protein